MSGGEHPEQGALTDTLPDLFPHVFPGHDQDAGLDLPPLTPAVETQIGDLLTSGRFDAWSEALARPTRDLGKWSRIKR